MKNWIRNIMLVAVAMTSLQAVANDEPHDTVYFYGSWEQIIDVISPYMVVIETNDDRYNDLIWNNHIAATLGDSIWLINTEYLKRDFDGDTRKLDAFAPFFFNEKVAYVVGHGNLSLKDLLFGTTDSYYSGEVDYFYIDFKNRKVLKVTPSVLIDLLEDYHDLQMRYEGMKDYKKRPIIEEYFFKFLDRASQDIMRPNILDLVDQ